MLERMEKLLCSAPTPHPRLASQCLCAPMTTLQQFQATRRHVQNLGPVVDAEQLDGCPGLVYGETMLHIETRRPEWSGTPAAAFQFLLAIGNQEWLSNDLPELEQRLYEYGTDEGIL